MVNLYRKGRIAEGKVARDLQSKGFQNIRKSSGSRGPADIYASKNGQKYYIQVKSGKSRATSTDINRLRNLAKRRRGAAVVINRQNGTNRWRFFGNWR
jgi:Holliday junction resolvase